MKQFILIAKFLLLSFFFTMCQRTGETLGGRKSFAYTLQEKEIIKIPLDSLTPVESNYLSVGMYEDNEVLLIENRFKNSIQFYSLSQFRKIHEIQVPKEGPGGVHEINGFIYINDDSIFVFEWLKPKMVLYNSQGHFKGQKMLTKAPFLNHASMTRLPIERIRNSLFLFVMPTINDRMFDGDTFFELKYDLKTETSEYLKFTWPQSYQGKRWSYFQTIPSRVQTGNHSLLYSFGIDSYLYEVFPDGSYEKHRGESAYIAQSNPLKEGEDEVIHFLQNGVYAMIIFDAYRKVYYRVNGLETTPYYKDGRIKSMDLKPYSITILDSVFNKIGEKKLEPVEKYLIKDWFVFSGGLCISLANSFNKDFDEDTMRFQVFELIKMQ